VGKEVGVDNHLCSAAGAKCTLWATSELLYVFFFFAALDGIYSSGDDVIDAQCERFSLRLQGGAWISTKVFFLFLFFLCWTEESAPGCMRERASRQRVRSMVLCVWST